MVLLAPLLARPWAHNPRRTGRHWAVQEEQPQHVLLGQRRQATQHRLAGPMRCIQLGRGILWQPFQPANKVHAGPSCCCNHWSNLLRSCQFSTLAPSAPLLLHVRYSLVADKLAQSTVCNRAMFSSLATRRPVVGVMRVARPHATAGAGNQGTLGSVSSHMHACWGPTNMLVFLWCYMCSSRITWQEPFCSHRMSCVLLHNLFVAVSCLHAHSRLLPAQL